MTNARRVILLLAALFAPMLAGAALAPTAHGFAGPVNRWYVHYGALVTGTSPNVWSNRQPTWSVGASDANLTFDPNGNLRVSGSSCPAANANVCWTSHTANVGPLPAQAYWDSRNQNTDSNFGIYTHEGTLRFSTNTGGWLEAQMILWSNGCLDIYTRNYQTAAWGAPLWANSSSSACAISQ